MRQPQRQRIARVSRARARARPACTSLLLLLSLAGCPHRGARDKHDAGPLAAHLDDAGALSSPSELPPAPPLPAVPRGLPAFPDAAELDDITANALALGALLFYDPRLSASGKTSCATCHDPGHGYSGGVDKAADGKANLRRTPALVNLAWATSFGWDGRYPTFALMLDAHMRGQMGTSTDVADKLAEIPLYAAHFARVDGTPPNDPTAAALAPNRSALVRGLSAFVFTRYAGDAPWDRREPAERAPQPGSAAPDDVVAGYLLFTGKAQCAVCHTPPLYTDNGFDRIGKVGVADQGRGRVDPALAGAFKTPTLRGAADRKSFFHTGDVTSLDDAIKWYELVGADTTRHDPATLNPALFHIALTPVEHQQLLAFVKALTSDAPPPAPPKLP